MYTRKEGLILTEWLSYEQKVWIAIVSAGIWIYFRTADCYSMIPRQHIIPVIFVVIWAYLNYYEPLFLPIGLCILILCSYFSTFLSRTMDPPVCIH